MTLQTKNQQPGGLKKKRNKKNTEGCPLGSTAAEYKDLTEKAESWFASSYGVSD